MCAKEPQQIKMKDNPSQQDYRDRVGLMVVA